MMGKRRGSTLIELMIVLVVIGILAILAVPRFLAVQARAKACEAKEMLKAVLVLEKAYLNHNGRYSASLDEIGFVQAPLVTDSPPGKARYRIGHPIVRREGWPTEGSEIEGRGKGLSQNLIVRATSVVDFDGDGQHNVWIIDDSGTIRELIPD